MIQRNRRGIADDELDRVLDASYRHVTFADGSAAGTQIHRELDRIAARAAEIQRAQGSVYRRSPQKAAGHRPATRGARPTMLRSVLNARAAAAAAAVAAVSFGGIATAAYASGSSLPAPIQRFAHEVIGAPAAPGLARGAHPAKSGTPADPDAIRRPAFGLCTAFAHANESGNAIQRSAAFRNLAAAAGGASKIASFCGPVPRSGASG